MDITPDHSSITSPDTPPSIVQLASEIAQKGEELHNCCKALKWTKKQVNTIVIYASALSSLLIVFELVLSSAETGVVKGEARVGLERAVAEESKAVGKELEELRARAAVFKPGRQASWLVRTVALWRWYFGSPRIEKVRGALEVAGAALGLAVCVLNYGDGVRKSGDDMWASRASR